MKSLNEYTNHLNESDIESTSEFANCINKYTNDNFGADCVKVITSYKDTENKFTKSKYGKYCFRGMFFNNMTPEKVKKLIETLPKKYKMDNIESWSSDYQEALIFAGGKSIYDVDRIDADEWDLVNQMDSTQCGVILKMENLDTKDVVFDAEHYLEDGNTKENIRIMEDRELIIKKKSNPKLYIFMLLYNGNVEYEIGQ